MSALSSFSHTRQISSFDEHTCNEYWLYAWRHVCVMTETIDDFRIRRYDITSTSVFDVTRSNWPTIRSLKMFIIYFDLSANIMDKCFDFKICFILFRSVCTVRIICHTFSLSTICSYLKGVLAEKNTNIVCRYVKCI